jgi:hypothetical protein
MSNEIYKIEANVKDATFVDIVRRLPRDRILQIALSDTYLSGNRGAFQGIELLKWIRVHGNYNHCILTSEFSLSDLLKKNPANAIIASKGTTFLESQSDEVCAKSMELADEQQLKQLFRLDIDLKQIRHDKANTFGLLRLRHNHLAIEPTTVFQTLKSDTELTSAIVSFIFSGPKRFTPTPSKIARVQTRLHKLRSHKSTVILIDDRASSGWANFLQILLSNNCTFHSLEPSKGETEATLATRISKLNVDVRDKHLLIFDLKLKESEATATDYRQLLSFKTVMRLRDQFGNRLRVMYLTASNDLSKFRTLLLNKKYNPHVVFTKEGADQLLSDEESFLHYVDLLDLLNGFLTAAEPRKIVETIQILNLIEEGKKSELAEIYRRLCKRTTGKNRFPSLDEYEEIYIDSNVFLNEDPELLLDLLIGKRHRVRIPATVKHELDHLSENSQHKKPLEALSASFFSKCIDELQLNIDWSNLSQRDIRLIKNGDQHPPDFADRHFELLMRDKDKQTLLISQDARVFNSCLSVVTQKGLATNAQSKPIDRPRPTPKARNAPKGNQTFIIRSISVTKDGERWILSQGPGDPINLAVRKTELHLLNFTELKKRLIGKKVNTESTSDDLNRLLGLN